MSKYQYNQKELNNDFGLLWSDYGARWLDLQRGVWGQIDPLAEKYVAWSGYNYVMGNPILMVDPDGPAALGVVDEVLDLTGKKKDFINYIDNTQFGQDMNKAGSGIRQSYYESVDGLYKMITGEGDKK